MNSKTRVLLVDDEEQLAEELADFLRLSGLAVVVRHNAIDSIQALNSDPTISHLVTDISIGPLSGLELLRKVKQTPHGARLRCIVFSGHASVDNLLAALRLGVADFLPKPVGGPELLDAIRRCSTPDAEPGAEAAASLDPASLLLAARKRRDALFGPQLFEDPVWNMLLDLRDSSLRGRPVTVSDLCSASGSSQTTALRRLNELQAMGLIERNPDARDRRRIFVRSTERGDRLMETFATWFSSMVGSS